MAFVVSRPFHDSNVGSNLSSLAGAAWLARALKRPLVVDWRGLSQLGDPSLNYFTEFFDAPATLAGVEVAYAPTDVAGPYEELLADDAVSPAAARAFATGVATPHAEPIVLQTYHGLDRVHPGPDSERLRLLRAFYEDIRPGPEVNAAIVDWWRTNAAGAFVVGVNVRTGNGRYFGKGDRYAGRVDVSLFDDERRFLAVLERACSARLRGLPKAVRETMVVFYATDSAQMSALLARLPNAITRRSVFPPPGTGDTYRFDGGDYSDHESIVDTLADMFLLARCDALVYNDSLFNQFARVSTGSFSGNQVQFESLFLRKRAEIALQSVRGRVLGP